MIPNKLAAILETNPRVMSGDICFAGTRVPVQLLLDTLDEGGSVDEFVEGYPDVSRDQAQAIVKWEQARARDALGIAS